VTHDFLHRSKSAMKEKEEVESEEWKEDKMQNLGRATSEEKICRNKRKNVSGELKWCVFC